MLGTTDENEPLQVWNSLVFINCDYRLEIVSYFR
jgi:hypothetical protein